MSLDYVRKGEVVRASTVNSLIDAVGGNERMSPDLDVTTTDGGPQVSMPSKFGGPNSKPRQLLEVGRYILSGWPMAKILLGPSIGDCLESMRYHAADGTVKNAVSAAVVCKNTSECPFGDQLSGMLLEEDDFGKDKEACAAGWVETMMEDPYNGKPPVRAELWAWDNRDKLAAVFTNAEVKDDVKEQLSSLLQEGGADQLSTLTRVDTWVLQEGKYLSNGQNNIPTHTIVKKTGTIDYFEQADAAEYKAVLKADLYCFAKEQDGSTKWTWCMPLGAGATCSSGKVHCPSLTYGGNPVVIEVTQNEVGPNYDGEANYYDGYLTYGLFTAQEGEYCDADEIWLNLSYDYNEKAVVGEFSDQESSTSYSSDGILHRNVLVAKASAFTPTEDTEVGDTSPREVVEHGTWGVLPKDGPKLDTYCKKDSSTEFKSLDWADRDGCTVDCQCAELHEFDQLETVDPLSTDHLVIRRPDDSDGAELKYISLSSLEISGMYVPPDADVPEAQTSSLQTRELDNGTNVEELFQFHLSDTVDVRISDLTSVDIVMRNPNDGQPYVQYGKLCIDIAPDAQGQTGQKSIDWLSSTHELQLYDFDQPGLTSAIETDVVANGSRESLMPNEYEFVLRKNGAGGEIAYGQIELSVQAPDLSGDSQVSSQKSISVDNGVINLYKMNEAGQEVSAEVPTSFEAYKNPLADVASDCEIVVRKGGAGGEIDYAKLKLKQAKLSTDTEAYPSQKSLEWLTADGKTFLQLEGFNQAGTALPVAELSAQAKSLLPADNELVIRKKVNGSWQIAYAPLSAKISATVEVDNDIVQTQRSLEWADDNGVPYLQLYDMDAAGTSLPQKAITMSADGYTPLLPSNYEFVLREDGAGGKIRYANLSCCIPDISALSGTVVSGDTEVVVSNKSIQTKEDQNGKKYYQLYDFDGCDAFWGGFTLYFPDSNGGCISPIGCQAAFVVRQPDGQRGHYVEYAPLQLTQSHEVLDSDLNGPGKSLQYTNGDDGLYRISCIELYNFNESTSQELEQDDVVLANGCDGILVRLNSGYRNELDYMTFSSLSNFTPIEKGDSNFQDNDDKSISTYLRQDNEYAIELYNWRTDGYAQTVVIHGDGCTYRWPQDTNITSTTNTADYILVKHKDSNGNMTLQYKQLQVTMPTLTGYDQDITNIYNEINDYSEQITIISGAVDALSGEISGLTSDYWESGGDSSTCYGSQIGDSGKSPVIDLDSKQLAGSWSVNTLEIDNYFKVDGTVDFYPNGCAYFTATPYFQNGATAHTSLQITGGCLVIGSTALSESQLQQLLALI